MITQEQQRERWDARKPIREARAKINEQRKERLTALLKEPGKALNVNHKATPKRKAKRKISKEARRRNR